MLVYIELQRKEFGRAKWLLNNACKVVAPAELPSVLHDVNRMVEEGYSHKLVDDAIPYCKAQLIAEMAPSPTTSGVNVEAWVGRCSKAAAVVLRHQEVFPLMLVSAYLPRYRFQCVASHKPVVGAIGCRPVRSSICSCLGTEQHGFK
eukprot:m.1578263 g.1578263  ORF g.1578263 m.1578263 type:complete len:147 (+) comp25312_c0_seq30:3375-3815(+)